jgi:hypothetical protein
MKCFLSFVRRALKDKFPTPTVPHTTVLPNLQVFLPDPVYVAGFLDNCVLIRAFNRLQACRLAWSFQTTGDRFLVFKIVRIKGVFYLYTYYLLHFVVAVTSDEVL